MTLARNTLFSVPGGAEDVNRHTTVQREIGANIDTFEPSDYVQALQTVLRGWVDYGKTDALSTDAYEVLRAVAEHYGQPISETSAITFDESQIEDRGLFDEAAVLFRQLQWRGPGAAQHEAPMPELGQLRAHFSQALGPAYQRRRTLDQLLSAPAAAAPYIPRFDGFAIQGAFGKTFDELLQSTHLSADATFNTLPVARKVELLREKFAEMGESTQYRIGSPQHSLASTLIRIARFSGSPVLPARFDNDVSLINKFIEAEKSWSSNRQQYPVHPRLLFGMHLARASGVEIMNTAGLYERYEAILGRAQGLRRRGQADPAVWLASVPAEDPALSGRGDSGWMHRETGAKRRSLLRAFEALRDMSRHVGNPAHTASPEPVWEFASAIQRDGLIGEILVGEDFKEKMAAVLAFASERLQAAFRHPGFSREEVTREILKRHGMGDAEIDETRQYTIFTSLGPDGDSVTRSGNRIEEFLARIDSGIPSEAQMQVHGRTVLLREELQRAEEDFNTRLEPWVRAKAKENLRMRSAVVTAATVNAEMALVAPQYRTETERERTARLDDEGVVQAILTIPVVGQFYTIYEGIRDKNGKEVLGGVLSLIPFVGSAYAIGQGIADRDGAEITMGALSLATEVGMHISLRALPLRQRPAVTDFHHIVTRLEMPTARIADVPLSGLVTDHPAIVRVADGNVPLEYRDLATRVRGGEAGVRWQGCEVVRLVNEGRIVPVKNLGGVYQEVDWQTGHRVRNAPLIQRDSVNRTFRSDLRLSGGLGWPSRTRHIKAISVESRLTPTAVNSVLDGATDAGIHGDFESRFRNIFSMWERGLVADNWALTRGGSGTDGARVFFNRLYERSYTFRRLFNHYYAKQPVANRHWKIHFGGRTGPVGDVEPRTFPLSRSIDIGFPVKKGFRSVNGVVPYSKENTLLHEVLHALTGEPDTPAPDRRVNARTLAQLDRGPIVYLTDKILSEAGYDYDERITYFEADEGDEGANRATERLGAAGVDAHVENRYLDDIVDRLRPAVDSDTSILNTPLGQRLTITQWQSLKPKLPNAGSAVTRQHSGSSWSKLQARFQFEATPTGPSKKLRQVSQRLLRDSPIFRALVESAPVDDADKWRFEFDEGVARAERGSEASSGEVDGPRRKIYLVEDNYQYLTESGLRNVEFERRVASGLVQALTDMSVPAELAKTNRGAVVRVVDQILKEAGFRFPDQLAAARAPADSVLLSYLTRARRSAGVEDAYLALQQ